MTLQYPYGFSLHITLEKNTSGRDFFVGDIHGQYSRLMTHLERVNFDENNDRLIATGDLIDRGTENLQVLDLLKKPWFFSVLGNHEVMLLEWLLKKSIPYYHMHINNGGAWVIGYEDAILHEYATLLLEHCPLAFTLPNELGQVGICHTDPQNNDWHNMQNLKPYQFSPEMNCLWSRHRYQQHRQQRPLPTIAHTDYVICGHVACEQVVWVANQAFIDTQYRSGELTVQTLEALLEKR